MMSKKRWSVRLGAGLLAALLAGYACGLAAEQEAVAPQAFGMAEYLLGMSAGTASQAFLESVQPLSEVAEADDIRLYLTGALYDGVRLALSWQTENLRPENPAVVEIESVTVNGAAVPLESTDLSGAWFPRMFLLGDTGDRFLPKGGGLVTGEFQGPEAGEISVEVSLVVSRPTGPLVIVDETMYYGPDLPYYVEDMQPEYDALMEKATDSGMEIAGPEALDAKEWGEKGYTVIDRTGDFLLWEGFSTRGRGSYTERPGQMEPSGSMTLTCAVAVEPGLAQAREATPAGTYDLDSDTAQVNRLVQTPLTTLLDVEVHFAEAMQKALSSDQGTAARTLWFAFADGEGKLLRFINMDYIVGFDYAKEGGQWVARLDMALPGLEAPATQLVLGYFGNGPQTGTLEQLLLKEPRCVVIPLEAGLLP